MCGLLHCWRLEPRPPQLGEGAAQFAQLGLGGQFEGLGRILGHRGQLQREPVERPGPAPLHDQALDGQRERERGGDRDHRQGPAR